MSCPLEPVIKLATLFAEESPAQITWKDVGENPLQISVRGRSAHGSKPQEGVNAVTWLVKFLNTLPLEDNAPGRAVRALAKKIGTETNGSGLGISRKDETGPLTLNVGYIHTLANAVQFGLDIRYPVSEAESFITEHVKDAFPAFDLEKTSSLAAHFVAPDSDLVVGLSTAYEEVMHEKAYCISMGGATYARAFPNSVAFGPLFPGQPATEHQPDEYIEIDSLIKVADLLAAAIAQLCGHGARG